MIVKPAAVILSILQVVFIYYFQTTVAKLDRVYDLVLQSTVRIETLNSKTVELDRRIESVKSKVDRISERIATLEGKKASSNETNVQ